MSATEENWSSKIRNRAQPLHKAERARKVNMGSKPRASKFVVGKCNVRSLAYKGSNGIGPNSKTVLQLCASSMCDKVGVEETGRADQEAFTHAGCVVLCSGGGGWYA